MKIFVICTVRKASKKYIDKLNSYVNKLEIGGDHVHLPHRDTNQIGRGIDICRENFQAIAGADEVHIFYNSDSQGTHFDMGMAFALHKKIVVIENVKYGEGKSYPRMIDEWEIEGT